MWVCNSTLVKLLPTQPCEKKHVEACPIMIDAPALRDTGLFTSHQQHALEKAYWFGAFHALQATIYIYMYIYICSLIFGLVWLG